MSGGKHSSDPTRALAELARLALSEHEAQALGAQLEQVLSYVRSLQAVDVEGVPEYLSAEQPGSALREDLVGPMLTPELALASSPGQRGGQLLVPKFKD